MKAILETGGKQYSVSVGDVIYVEKLNVEADKKVVFDKVLMANGVVGNPYVKGASVEGKVIKNGKGKKIGLDKLKPYSNRAPEHFQRCYLVERKTGLKPATHSLEGYCSIN